MIIVEGCDGTGKSTLVSRIEADWGLLREPRAVSSAAEALVPTDSYIEQELAKGFGMRLYDRFALISSPLYMMLPTPTFSGMMLDPHWLRAQYYKFARIQAAVIYCIPPYEEVVANLEREDNSGGKVGPHTWQIYHSYIDSFARQSADTNNVMIWDYTKPDTLRLTNLLRWAQANDQRLKDQKRGR